MSSTLADAARRVAEADAQYKHAEAVLRVAMQAHEQAHEVYLIAGEQVNEAVQTLIAAIRVEPTAKTVKRPADLDGDLLDLDDNGGH